MPCHFKRIEKVYVKVTISELIDSFLRNLLVIIV